MNTDNVGRFALSLLVIVAFCGYITGVMLISIPTEMRDVVNTAGGFLAGAFTLVVSYWVGSSAGSSAKDKTIAASLPPQKEPTQ